MIFNHGWTPMNTDKSQQARKPAGQQVRIPACLLASSVSIRVYPCPSVVKQSGLPASEP